MLWKLLLQLPLLPLPLLPASLNPMHSAAACIVVQTQGLGALQLILKLVGVEKDLPH